MLNKNQMAAIYAIQNFLESPSTNTFILTGFAGTGKTFLMQYLGTMLKKRNRTFNLLASTGRAAAVLRGKTGFDAKTVHSELYSFSKVDGDDEKITDNADIDQFGQMKLIFSKRESDEEERLYIVDEASMLADEPGPDTSFAVFGSGLLLMDFLQSIRSNKVIFVGDPCQLPPVGQRFSPALSKSWLESQGRIVVTATLEEIIRTKDDNDILELATYVRGLFEQEVLPKWVKLPARNRKNITVFPTDERLIQAYTKKALATSKGSCIAIAQSNTLCGKLNERVREAKYGSSNEPLQVGDTLLVTQNNYLVPLTNGDFIEILAIGEKRTKANLNFVNVRVKALLQEVDYELLLCLDVFVGRIANITSEQHRDLMIDFSRRMRKKGIKANSLQYKTSMLQDPYLNSLRAVYGYAINCHKSQGGEWDEVFLFLNKSMFGMERSTLFKWWYTAITRAREHLYLHQDWWII
jgi:ATP-dependent exoDNAse (exonuclease V) alpha subunit